MSYESCVLKGLYVVRWGEKPELRDLHAYLAEITAARERQGAPLVALFIMPQDSAVPDDAFRRAQSKILPELMKHASHCIAVFEGSGFVVSLKRSALGAILLFAPKRYRIAVRSSVEDALIHSPPGPLGFDPYSALAELKRRNMC